MEKTFWNGSDSRNAEPWTSDRLWLSIPGWYCMSVDFWNGLEVPTAQLVRLKNSSMFLRDNMFLREPNIMCAVRYALRNAHPSIMAWQFIGSNYLQLIISLSTSYSVFNRRPNNWLPNVYLNYINISSSNSTFQLVIRNANCETVNLHFSLGPNYGFGSGKNLSAHRGSGSVYRCSEQNSRPSNTLWIVKPYEMDMNIGFTPRSGEIF